DDPDAPVTTLSGGEKQSVTIARAMYFKAHVLILDEPTNQLSVKESKYVFDFVKSLKKQGVSNIFITHNIYQVFQVADRIMVLSHGRKIADLDSKQTSPEDISEMILKS
nr:ATP-binding cassette domain-containing protein [bacterium]NIO20057.1 ATP-binding cassette domain-containing protein [Candidatus Aenigmarchaeota archaeon]NIO74069.1 ATP-binding cassette domain-containing protein [bacterium]